MLTDQPTTTRFVYDGARLSAELNNSGAVKAEYIYQGHRPVALVKDKRLYAVHTNRRAAPIAVADSHGTIVWTARYSAFGKATVDTDPDGDGTAFTFNLRLPGQYADAETGTYYNIHRDYDPSTGRYLTSDPLGVGDGANTYAYVHSDPMNRIDPLGLFAMDVHYYAVYFLAREAGIDADTTQIIANASEYVDINEQTLPCSGFKCTTPNPVALPRYHFTLEGSTNHGDFSPQQLESRLKQANLIPDSFDLNALSLAKQQQWYTEHRFLLPRSTQLARLRRAAFILNPGVCETRSPFAKPQLFGEYLHALGDSFAHRDRMNIAYSVEEEFPLLGGPIGHGGDLHNPDNTYNHRGASLYPPGSYQWNYNEIRTLAAEHAIFYQLRNSFRDEINTAGLSREEYDTESNQIWQQLSGAADGKVGYARVGYNSMMNDLNPFTGDHPIDGPENDKKPIGVLQRFNADHDFDEDDPLADGSKVNKLTAYLSDTIAGPFDDLPQYDDTPNHDPVQDRIKYLGNITDDDLRDQGFTYTDGEKLAGEPALLLPCGYYKPKAACSE